MSLNLQGRMRLCRLWATIVAILGLACSWAEAPFLSYHKVYGGYVPERGLTPLQVTVTGSDNDAVGLVTLNFGTYSMRYPVSVAKGTEQEFTVYIPSDQGMYSNCTLNLESTAGNRSVEIDTNLGTTNMRAVLLIGDTPGALKFLEQSRKAAQIRTVIDVKPESAPTRSGAYSAFAFVILGPGSERLSSESVSAIKRFGLSGGTIVLTGGSSGTNLRSPVWSQFVPVTGLKIETVPGLSFPNGRVEGPVTLTVGDKPSGSFVIGDTGSAPAIAAKRGLGLCVALPYDPFDGPMARSTQRQPVFDKIAELSTKSGTVMVALSGDSAQRQHASQAPAESSDPFQAKLPDSGRVSLLLLGYMVAVLPVNFLLLRLLNKRNWAWATVPALSLLFSFGLFQLSEGLYKNKAAHALSGVLVAQHGVPEAQFVGSQMMFVPNAKSMDLGLVGVEQFSSSEIRRFDLFTPVDQGFQGSLVDVGEIIAPSASFTNLCFREMRLSQKLQSPQLEVTMSRNGARVQGVIRNTSPMTIYQPRILAQGMASDPIKETLPPGASTVVDVTLKPDRQFVLATRPDSEGAIVLGRFSGARIGAQVGEEVPGQSRPWLAYGFNLK